MIWIPSPKNKNKKKSWIIFFWNHAALLCRLCKGTSLGINLFQALSFLTSWARAAATCVLPLPAMPISHPPLTLSTLRKIAPSWRKVHPRPARSSEKDHSVVKERNLDLRWIRSISPSHSSHSPFYTSPSPGGIFCFPSFCPCHPPASCCVRLPRLLLQGRADKQVRCPW